ncbi:hypothetical protein N2152v2_000713 [Parachlorella kessleri]
MGSPAGAVAFLETLVVQWNEDSGDGQLFDTTALQGLKDITAEHGRVTCRLPVRTRVQNRYGTLHGGCIATLVDTVGTAALLTLNGRSGVSLAINVDYLRGMPGGSDVVVDAKVVKVGKTIATINVELRDQDSGKLCAQGTHVKFMSEDEPDIGEQLGNIKEQPRSKL